MPSTVKCVGLGQGPFQAWQSRKLGSFFLWRGGGRFNLCVCWGFGVWLDRNAEVRAIRVARQETRS